MIRTIVIGLMLATVAQGFAAQPTNFGFHKDIERRDAGKESIVAATLDPEVYVGTRNDFADLRVFDAEGRETPFLVEPVTEKCERIVRAACGSRVASLKEEADRLEIVVSLNEGAPPATDMTIVTPLVDYERQVRVFGTKDGKEWKPLVTDGLLFDYSRYVDLRNSDIRLPPNDCRQLKVVISGIEDSRQSPLMELTRKYEKGRESEREERTTLRRRPFRIDRIELSGEQTERLADSPKQTNYRVSLTHVDEDAADKTTIATLDARREPLTSLTLRTNSRNFSRPAVVQVMTKYGGNTRWTDIAHGQLTLLDFGRYHRESLTLTFPEQRQSHYRIVVRNEDSRPLKISGVTSSGITYRVVFLAEAGQSYRLAYGSENVESPRYDVAAVLAPLRAETARTDNASLGPQIANTQPVEAAPTRARSLVNDPLVMGGVIAALVAVLAWALYRAARRIGEIPKE